MKKRLAVFGLLIALAPLVRLEMRCPPGVTKTDAFTSAKCTRKWTVVFPWWRMFLK